jgi:hypothetical protein
MCRIESLARHAHAQQRHFQVLESLNVIRYTSQNRFRFTKFFHLFNRLNAQGRFCDDFYEAPCLVMSLGLNCVAITI